MPTKVRLIKLLDEIRDAEHVPLRRYPLKPVMLYLMELRKHVAETHLPKEKLVIPVDSQNNPDMPHPVKITHLTHHKPADVPPVPSVSN